MQAPRGDSSRPDAKDSARALRPSVQLTVSQGTADELGRLFFLDIEMDQAVARVTKAAFEKAVVEGEEGRLAQRVQQRQNLSVLHPQSTDFHAYAAGRDTPAPQ
jgi:hypothetical protein